MYATVGYVTHFKHVESRPCLDCGRRGRVIVPLIALRAIVEAKHIHREMSSVGAIGGRGCGGVAGRVS